MRAKKPTVNGGGGPLAAGGRGLLRDVDPEGHRAQPRAGQVQVARHVLGVEIADRDEARDGVPVRPDQAQRLRAVFRGKALQEEVLALQRAAHRPPQGADERRGEAEQQRVGQHDEVERRLPADPLHELHDLLALEAVLAPQHRHRHRAQEARIDAGHGSSGHRAQDRRSVPHPVEDGRGVPEQRHVLLQVDADPAEEHAVVAHVGLVGEGRACRRAAARRRGRGPSARRRGRCPGGSSRNTWSPAPAVIESRRIDQAVTRRRHARASCCCIARRA